MDDFNFKNGKKAFSKIHGDFYYDNGKIAYKKIFGDVYYRNGKQAYKSIHDKAFYENGKPIGQCDGGSYSAEGVTMNLGSDVDSFECELGEGLTVQIQVGHNRDSKRAQLYGANGGLIFED